VFLSRLLLNPSCRQARADLANCHDLHRTLWRAFPDQADGGPGRVLFRLELARDTGTASVLVQSEKPPDWAALSREYLLRPAESKPFAPAFAAGQRLQFRLRANPATKTGTTSKADRLAGKPRCNGRRVGIVHEEEQVGWLRRKGEAGGFRVHGVTVVPEGLTQGFKTANEVCVTLPLLAARFDGLLEVTDPDRFLQTVEEGVGPAKGLGFGLLSLARAEG
jgi:CRISPR system Cascade subunit CasE